MPPKRQKWVGADLHKGTLFGTLGSGGCPAQRPVAVASPLVPHVMGQQPGLGQGASALLPRRVPFPTWM